MGIEVEDLAESLLIKRRKVFNGANGKLFSIPAIREKVFGKMDTSVVVLIGKYIVLIPDGKKQVKLDRFDYARIMESIEDTIEGR